MNTAFRSFGLGSTHKCTAIHNVIYDYAFIAVLNNVVLSVLTSKPFPTKEQQWQLAV